MSSNTPLSHLNSNQVYQILLKSDVQKQKTRLKSIVEGHKSQQKKSLGYHLPKSKFSTLRLGDKNDESSKQQTTSDENLTQRSGNFNESLKKSRNGRMDFSSTQTTQASQKSLTNLYENRSLSEILEKKILELLQKNERLEKKFKQTLLDRNRLEKENTFLVKQLNLSEEESEKKEQKHSNKISVYKKKIKELEVELLESHDNIIDLEKKMKILTTKH